MKSFKQKQSELTDLSSRLTKSKIVIISSFSRAGEKGLNVSQIKDLKKHLRIQQAEYVVTKKTLLDKALGQTDKELKGKALDLEGSLGVAFGYGEESATAKTLFQFAKTNPLLKLLGGLFGKKFITAQTVEELAKLPNRETMLARALGMLNYPLTGLVTVLQGNIRNLVGVLGQISNKK